MIIVILSKMPVLSQKKMLNILSNGCNSKVILQTLGSLMFLGWETKHAVRQNIYNHAICTYRHET